MAFPQIRSNLQSRREGRYPAVDAPASSPPNDGSDVEDVCFESSTQSLEHERRACPPGPELHAWGHLVALEKIACGAFASVYRASDPLLQRDVALKLYGQGKYSAEGWFQLGLREARLLGRIRHPNVVTIYGADHRQGRLGIWMEYIDGKTLDTLLRDLGPLGAPEAALLVFDVCAAVASIHALGLLHCDITSRNVMREAGGRVVLMDFGFSQDLRLAPANGVPRICGTPLYMAPELLTGQPCSARSDIYSIGVLLYRLVTGAFPVEANSINEVRAIHAENEAVLLRDRRPDLPEPFLRIVEEALAPDPERRFETCGHMARALSAFLHGG